MNLVAKEFVCARDDEHGVLVLSDRAGAALQLREALLINPWSVASSSDAMWTALTMPESEQVKRMRRLRLSVAGADAACWSRRLLADADSVPQTGRGVESRAAAEELSA
jgi:trehalose 6-phosphate synthase